MWHDIAPDAATAALAVIGALHVAWAFTPWPAPTYNTQQVRVRRPGDAVEVGVHHRRRPLDRSRLRRAGRRRDRAAVRPGGDVPARSVALAALLLARGVAGPLFSMRGDRELRFWNLAAYSPLCLALGPGALIALR